MTNSDEPSLNRFDHSFVLAGPPGGDSITNVLAESKIAGHRPCLRGFPASPPPRLSEPGPVPVPCQQFFVRPASNTTLSSLPNCVDLAASNPHRPESRPRSNTEPPMKNETVKILITKSEFAAVKRELEELRGHMTAIEDERSILVYNQDLLRKRMNSLLNSSWLKIGHNLGFTRTLRSIRSDLTRISDLPHRSSQSAMPEPPGMVDCCSDSEDHSDLVDSLEQPEIIAFHAASTARALERIVGRGLDIGTVIDVGASNGMWSEVAENYLPEANYLLVEAQNFHLAALETYCREHDHADFVIAAAGDANGEVFFDDRAPFGGVASKEQTSYAKTSVPMYSLDYLVESRGLQGPFLVKLDTHGFEVPILNGASETLKNTNLVVIEVYNFRILDQSLIFHEMCAFMSERGFGVIDISEPLWRARDNAFWQMDLFFVPLGRSEFCSTSYE